MPLNDPINSRSIPPLASSDDASALIGEVVLVAGDSAGQVWIEPDGTKLDDIFWYALVLGVVKRDGSFSLRVSRHPDLAEIAIDAGQVFGVVTAGLGPDEFAPPDE